MATTTSHENYGAAVSIAVKKASASKYKKRLGLAYPLVGKLTQATGRPPSLQSSTNQGSYFSKAYGIALIKNNLRQLLMCDKGERIMLPTYGLSLNKYLFEPLDETTFFLIRQDILTTLERFFSIVNVINLKVFSSPRADREHQLIVDLTLQLLDESLDLFDVEVKLG